MKGNAVLTSETINKLLISNFPDQTTILGQSKTQRLARAVADNENPALVFHQAQGGANLDPLTTLQILIAAATLIKLCLDIKEKFDTAGQRPTEDEFVEEVSANPQASDIAQFLEQALKLMKDTYQALY